MFEQEIREIQRLMNMPDAPELQLSKRPFDIKDGELYLIYYKKNDSDRPTYVQLLKPDQLKEKMVDKDGVERIHKHYQSFSLPEYATLFETNQFAQGVAITVNEKDSKTHIGQVKDLCEIYYIIEKTYKKDHITIGKEWSYKDRNSNSDSLSKLYYNLNQFNEFVAKLKDVKFETIQHIHTKMLEVYNLNPNDLL